MFDNFKIINLIKILEPLDSWKVLKINIMVIYTTLRALILKAEDFNKEAKEAGEYLDELKKIK